ncbi:MAG: polymer-forming cytoskeletal protein [Rhodobacteraceae bacterium]|nr:polymer-forming cytoskeletal protein [Paracoccaceae bacterium]
MFSKNKSTNEGATPVDGPASGEGGPPPASIASEASPAALPATRGKPPASLLAADLTIVGNIKTSGDVQIEGKIEGDIRAHLLTIGESATIKGECLADDVVVHGRVIGKVRGLKVRLTATARVEGDIVHKTIAIESGAHFEGSVQRQDDPLNAAGKPRAIARATVES